jgi:hypothetical protein
LVIQRLDDKLVRLPAGNTLSLDGTYRNHAVLAECELFDDGTIETDEKPIPGLGNLEVEVIFGGIPTRS